eukprot:24710-Alexandrium_andersonii.AAC.1
MCIRDSQDFPRGPFFTMLSAERGCDDEDGGESGPQEKSSPRPTISGASRGSENRAVDVSMLPRKAPSSRGLCDVYARDA